MRPDRLLREERGSAPVETIGAIVMLVVLTLGAVEVAFALYARNVVMSAAHEGARAVAERGAVAADARELAAAVVARSAGGLVDGLAVDVTTTGTTVRVSVRAKSAPFGPVPVALPLRASATSFLDSP
jgi:Flp pilus assembly protein TadG